MVRAVPAQRTDAFRAPHRAVGADVSSDKLRRCARCAACGHKGATPEHSGWVDTVVGFQPFPTAQARRFVTSALIQSLS